ncbi:MAG: hypothetical protein IJH34_10250, partial [Romboutsia sp.]|nr:hypothetical protein [Romboutsia sp.]
MARKKNCRQFKDEFIKLYKEGMSLRQIALKYEISKNVISNLVKEDMQLRQKSGVEGMEKEFYELYQQGRTINSIANEYNVSYSSVSRLLRKHFNIEKSNRKYEHLVENFKREYKEGKSLTKIAEKYNVSRQTILDYISEEKVKSRNYSETSRIYSLDEDYFNKINEIKAYQLGIFYAIGSMYNESTIDLKIINKKSDLIFEAIKGISDKTSKNLNKNKYDNSVCLRLNSKILKGRLDEIGLSKGELNINKEFRKYFFDGYFKGNMKISTEAITINKSKNKYGALIKDYLINNLNL